jgi:hypothetical protein
MAGARIHCGTLSRSIGASATKAPKAPITASASASAIRKGVGFRRTGDDGSRCRCVRSAAVAAIAADGAVAALAAISAGYGGLIQRRCDRLRTACVRGNRLAVAAQHAGVAWIDSVLARRAVIALDSHNLRANAARADHHEGQRRNAGHQCPHQN